MLLFTDKTIAEVIGIDKETEVKITCTNWDKTAHLLKDYPIIFLDWSDLRTYNEMYTVLSSVTNATVIPYYREREPDATVISYRGIEDVTIMKFLYEKPFFSDAEV